MNYGHVKLMQGSHVLFEADCDPGLCEPEYTTGTDWLPPNTIVVRAGKTLSDQFVCDADLITPEIQDCASAGVPEGAFIDIGIEVFPAP
jgi:hypothetical protein